MDQIKRLAIVLSIAASVFILHSLITMVFWKILITSMLSFIGNSEIAWTISFVIIVIYFFIMLVTTMSYLSDYSRNIDEYIEKGTLNLSDGTNG
jgi:uncharacterized membrane protein YccC